MLKYTMFYMFFPHKIKFVELFWTLTEKSSNVMKNLTICDKTTEKRQRTLK